MYFFKFPKLLRPLFKNVIFTIKNTENKVFITFDDCTNVNLLLQILNYTLQKEVKATFFCTGKIFQERKDFIKRILKEGHILGNHTFDHKSFFKVGKEKYIESIIKYQNLYKAKLFRPPYGHILPFAIKEIEKQGLKTVLWDILTYDFDKKISNEKILKKVCKIVKSGSIIAFHINNKTENRLIPLLDDFLKCIRKKNLLPERILF